MRVVIADDEVLLREGLERLLLEAGFEVVGKVGTAEELVRKVELARPDLAIVDIRMPPSHTDEGIVAAQEIRGQAELVEHLRGIGAFRTSLLQRGHGKFNVLPRRAQALGRQPGQLAFLQRPFGTEQQQREGRIVTH